MKKGVIYCSISPSNKKYYGYSVNFENRKKKHYKEAQTKNNLFYKAIRKYGFENFKWEIIEIYEKDDIKDLFNILCKRETYWIEKDKTYLPEFGYNMTHGGGGVLGYKFLNRKASPKTLQIQRDINLGEKNPMFNKHLSQETKDKISTNGKGRQTSLESRQNYIRANAGSNNPMFNKHLSDESKAKLSLSMKKAWLKKKLEIK